MLKADNYTLAFQAGVAYRDPGMIGNKMRYERLSGLAIRLAFEAQNQRGESGGSAEAH